MDISTSLSRLETLTNALTILEGQYNDPDCDIEEKCIELFTNLTDVKKGVDEMRQTLRGITGEIKIMAVNIDKLETLRKRIIHIRSQLPEESNGNPIEPRPLHMDINETINAQDGVSPVPVSWAQLVSPNPPDAQPVKPQARNVKALPIVSYVTEAEVSAVPKYMKGRFNAVMLNKLIDSLNMAFKKKYEIITRPKKSIKQKDLEYYCEWKREENTEPKGTHFITVRDVNNFGNTKMDKASFNMITILRHLKRIKETRHSNNQIHFVLL